MKKKKNTGREPLIPAHLIDKNNRISIQFDVKYPESPERLGLSGDKRLLGIGLKSLKVHYPRQKEGDKTHVADLLH